MEIIGSAHFEGSLFSDQYPESSISNVELIEIFSHINFVRFIVSSVPLITEQSLTTKHTTNVKIVTNA